MSTKMTLLTISFALAAGQETEQPPKLISPGWEKTISGLRTVQFDRESKLAICTTREAVIGLSAKDGSEIWRHTARSPEVLAGQKVAEIIVRASRTKGFVVCSTTDGKVSRKFDGPSGVRFATGSYQDREGWIYCLADNATKLVRFREGDQEFEVLFDRQQARDVMDVIVKSRRIRLIGVTPQAAYFTVGGRLGILNLKTRKVATVKPDARTRPDDLLSLPMAGDSVAHTVTADFATLVAIDENAAVREVAVFDQEDWLGARAGFVTKDSRLVVYAEDTGERQPAFLRVVTVKDGKSQRVQWHTDEIRSVTPNQDRTDFLVNNGSGLVALWRVGAGRESQ